MSRNRIVWNNLTVGQIEWLKEILHNNLIDIVYDAKRKPSILNKYEAKGLLKRVEEL